MGLSCYFEIGAPSTKKPEELETFLRTVERQAKRLGFSPTLVLNVPFDTRERVQFARRLTTGYFLEHEKLRSTVTVQEGQTFSRSPSTGSCRLAPEHGVVLVVTDERGCETVLGFLRYP